MLTHNRAGCLWVENKNEKQHVAIPLFCPWGKVFNCLNSFNRNYRNSISCFLEDSDPIWQNVHFMFFERYWSHIQDFHLIGITKFPTHVFSKIWIPYTTFSFNWNCNITKFMLSGRYWSHIQEFHDFIKRIFRNFRTPPLPTLSKTWNPHILRFSKIIFVKNDSGFLDFFKVTWCLRSWE